MTEHAVLQNQQQVGTYEIQLTMLACCLLIFISFLFFYYTCGCHVNNFVLIGSVVLNDGLSCLPRASWDITSLGPAEARQAEGCNPSRPSRGRLTPYIYLYSIMDFHNGFEMRTMWNNSVSHLTVDSVTC